MSANSDLGGITFTEGIAVARPTGQVLVGGAGGEGSSSGVYPMQSMRDGLSGGECSCALTDQIMETIAAARGFSYQILIVGSETAGR